MGKHLKIKNKKILILYILRIIFIITLIISITYIVKWYINNKQNELIKEKISDVVIVKNEKAEDSLYEVDFERLKEINNQIVAWLKVKETNIEYPVVQAKDNNYYLKRNLNKEYSFYGWIFADYRNKLDGTDKNIIVYGHNMKDDSMFGSLKNILTEEWYNNEENHIIEFITENEKQKYQVFSIYEIESEDYYIKTEFKDNEFEEFIKTLKNRSIKDFRVEISSEDSILTLSTCSNNNKYRVVLHARKIK